MDPLGHSLTIWSARLAAVLYLAWIVFLLRRRERPALVVSTLALAVYLFHVLCAFQFFYRWSHTFALQETARQTRELFGVDSGAGLYLNYLFTAAWLADCLQSWFAPRSRRHRPHWLTRALHMFLAFMWINATLVVWLIRASR